MQMVKIRINDRDDRGIAIVAIARRGQVVCLRDNVFIIPEPALQILNEMHVNYVELGRGGLDYGEKELHDAQTKEG